MAMKSIWAVAATSACALVWACGSDVVNVGDPSATSGGQAGGAGGASASASTSATTTSTASSTASTTASSSTGMPGSPCEQACDKIANECGFGNVCSMIPFLDCSEMSSDCYGTCILQADCSALPSLLSSNPDPSLASCINACMGTSGSCQQCVINNCSAEAQTCQGNPSCQAFLTCASGCNGFDCINDCAVKNPSTETTALLGCANTNCSSECAAMGGSGGAGGQGGAGQGGQGGQGGQ